MTITKASTDWEHTKCLSASHINLRPLTPHYIAGTYSTFIPILQMRKPTHQGQLLIQGQSGSSRTGVQTWANLIPMCLCSQAHHIMLLPTLSNGNVTDFNRHSRTNTSKWVTSEDVALGRLCSYSSDAVIIPNTATAELNDLWALDLKIKMPSEPKPMTLDIFNWDKSSSFEHRFDVWQPKIRKTQFKKTYCLIKLGIFK